eukprot:1779077-Rhodomonas_salina.1
MAVLVRNCQSLVPNGTLRDKLPTNSLTLSNKLLLSCVVIQLCIFQFSLVERHWPESIAVILLQRLPYGLLVGASIHSHCHRELWVEKSKQRRGGTVSYTHLTLPTICSV